MMTDLLHIKKAAQHNEAQSGKKIRGTRGYRILMAGYDLGNPLGTQDSESANGIIQTQLFEVREFAALGISRKNYVVQAMDFLAHGMVSNYQGLLGMDFFEGTKFCIDTVRNQITIEPILV
jgi:hypothetical protein